MSNDTAALKEFEPGVYIRINDVMTGIRKEVTLIFEPRDKGIRIEAMKEVRGVTQSQPVQEIAAKLKVTIPSTRRLDRPGDHRAHRPMER